MGQVVVLGALLGAGGLQAAPAGGAEGVPVGTVLEHRDPGAMESQRFFVDPNAGGLASEIRIAGQFWGRLVDVYGLDGGGDLVLQQKDFVIGGDVDSDGVDYTLERNAHLAIERLVILRDVTDESPGGGLEQFIDLLRQAGSSLTPISEQGPGSAGIYSMIPRNATVVVQFDDLLDADLVTAENLQLASSPIVPPYRVLVDRNHGGLGNPPGDDRRRFYTTRALLDLTVTPFEAEGTSLVLNEIGLLPSGSAAEAGFLLRVPTQEDPATGQTTILRNLTGGPVAASGNGPVDFNSPTVDVLRAARPGGPTDVTGDPFNGFLRDPWTPQLIGGVEITIGQRPRPDSTGNPYDFRIRQIRFDTRFCAWSPRRGDILTFNGFYAEVRSDASLGNGGQVFGLKVRLLNGDPAVFEQVAIGPAWLGTTFDPVEDADRAICFVTSFAPGNPQPPWNPEQPWARLDPESVFTVVFSEPMSVDAFEIHSTLSLTRTQVPVDGTDYVPGSLGYFFGNTPEASSQFTFRPQKLSHTNGFTEGYYLNLDSGSFAPVDLAGNAFVGPFPQVGYRLDPDAPTFLTDGRVTRFSDPDEEPPFGDGMTGPLPEWTGQFLYDLARERVRPRAVTRYTAVVDRNQAVPSLMTQFVPGVQSPLSPLGSITQALWRYVDLGFSLTDFTDYNLDVEGLSWSPVGGAPVADSFAEFEIRLGHSRHLPDEAIEIPSLFPEFPNSGVKPTFAVNSLDGPEVVHPRALGYAVDPGDLFVSSGGTPLMPYPLNRSVPADEAVTYTWRDTAILERDGAFNDGADPKVVIFAGLPRQQVYSTQEIQSVGLPLLMEFRCYPDSGALGLNAFDVSLAVNSSARPYFRAFSTGGVDSGGTAVQVDPDLETVANGGFNPANGQPTPGNDPVSYIGAMDFVVRVSRMVSVWFTTDGSASIANPVFAGAGVFPRDFQQPEGTGVQVEYRGASAVLGISAPAAESALSLDAYGDHYAPMVLRNSNESNRGITFVGQDDAWRSDPSEIDGARLYQLRVTLWSNIATGETPTVSSLSTGWSE